VSDTKDNGGAAFPVAGERIGATGMSLRDWFAGNAPVQPDDWTAPRHLLKIVARPSGISGADDAWWAYYEARAHNDLMHEVTWRWAYADAMLAARKGGSE